jgi:hypothetical protein
VRRDTRLRIEKYIVHESLTASLSTPDLHIRWMNCPRVIIAIAVGLATPAPISGASASSAPLAKSGESAWGAPPPISGASGWGAVDATLPESDSFQCNSSKYLEIVHGKIKKPSSTSFTFDVDTGMFQMPTNSVLHLAKGSGFSVCFSFTLVEAQGNQQMLYLESTAKSSTFKLQMFLRNTTTKAFHYRYVALCIVLQWLVISMHAVKMLMRKESMSSTCLCAFHGVETCHHLSLLLQF